MSYLDELVVQITYSVDKDAEKKITDATRTASVQARLMVDAVERGMTTLLNVFSTMGTELEGLAYKSQRAKMTIEELRSLGYAAAQTGSSVGELQASVEAFSEQLRRVPQWKYAIRSMLGIDPDNEQYISHARNLYKDVASAIAAIDYEPTRLRLAELMHIPLKIIDSFRSGEAQKHFEEAEKRAARMGVTDEDERKAVRFRQTVREIDESWALIWIKFQSTFISRFGDAMARFGDYLIANGPAIADMLARLAGALMTIIEWLVKAGLAVDKFVQATIGWKSATALLGATLLWFATPIGKIVTGLAALAGLALPSWLLALLGIGGAYFGIRAMEGGAGEGGGGGEAPAAPGGGGGGQPGGVGPDIGEGSKPGGYDPNQPNPAVVPPDQAVPSATPTGPYGQNKELPQLQNAPGRRPDLQHVDPRLVSILQAAQTHLPDHEVQIREGFNPMGHTAGSAHKKMGSGAIDLQIVDKKTGRVLPNRGFEDPDGPYHRLARAAYGEMLARYPELKGRLSWGGAHGTVSGGGPPDLMHYDVSGERGRYRENLLSRMGPLPTFAANQNVAGINQNKAVGADKTGTKEFVKVKHDVTVDAGFASGEAETINPSVGDGRKRGNLRRFTAQVQ